MRTFQQYLTEVDVALRSLERAAASGDLDALAQLDHARRRAGKTDAQQAVFWSRWLTKAPGNDAVRVLWLNACAAARIPSYTLIRTLVAESQPGDWWADWENDDAAGSFGPFNTRREAVEAGEREHRLVQGAEAGERYPGWGYSYDVEWRARDEPPERDYDTVTLNLTLTEILVMARQHRIMPFPKLVPPGGSRFAPEYGSSHWESQWRYDEPNADRARWSFDINYLHHRPTTKPILMPADSRRINEAIRRRQHTVQPLELPR